MITFFKGWRRKVGVATLFLALVFTGGWVKSWADHEVVCISNGNLTDELSMSGKIGVSWSSDHIEGNKQVPGFQLEVSGLYGDMILPKSERSDNEPASIKFATDVPGVSVDFNLAPNTPAPVVEELQRRVFHVDGLIVPAAAPEGPTTSTWQRCGFYVIKSSTADDHWTTDVLIPYWSIVIPLTLLSAVLLIKPRSPRLRLQTIPAPSF